MNASMCVCVWILFRGLAIYFAQVLISGKFPSTISLLRAAVALFPHLHLESGALSPPLDQPTPPIRPPISRFYKLP